MSKKVKFEESSGNVFADLDLPNAEELHLKAKLGYEVFRIIQARKLTQAEAAEILGVKQPEISRLKNGKFNHYSVERLLTFLNLLNHDIKISIVPAENRIGEQRVMKAEPKKQDEPDMLDEYDLSEGVRDKYAEKNLIRLDDDVAKMFPDSKSFNDALRLLAKIVDGHQKTEISPENREESDEEFIQDVSDKESIHDKLKGIELYKSGRILE